MGYSNIAGDLNVYTDTSTSSLTVRNDTTLLGNLTAISGFHTFGNVVAGNLVVTGNFTITATNTQVSNSLSINNAGTATALKVVQYEGGVHNVAEFWDFHTLAMVIDAVGNVGIHTTSSPNYSLTVYDGAYITDLTLANSLPISSGGTGATTAAPNFVFAGPFIGSAAPPSFRALVNSDLPSYISVSNISANGSALSSLTGANVTGNVAQATLALVVSQAAQPNITSVGTLTGLTVSGILSADLYVGNASGLSNLNSSNLVGNVANANVALVVSQAAQPNITSVGTLTGLTVSGILSAGLYVGNASGLSNLNSSNLVGNVANANVALVVSQAAQPNITSVGLLSNLAVSNSVTTTNLFATNGLDVGPGTLGTNVAIFSNVSGGSNVFGMDSNATVVIGLPPSSNVNYGAGYPNTSKAVLVLNGAGSATYPITLSLLGRDSGIDFGGGGQSAAQIRNSYAGGGAGSLSFWLNNSNGADGNISEKARFTHTGLFGVGTSTPGATIHAVGNIYASNALQTTNVFVDKGLDVGPGTLGTNVVIFSNASGGSNVFVMNSNGRIGIGTTNPGAQLDIYSTTAAEAGATVTNSGGSITINAGVNAIYFSTAGTIRAIVNASGFTPYTDLTYNLGNPAGNRWNYLVAGTAALTGGGANVYAANAVTTTNVFATTANVMTLNVATISNLNTLVLTNNLYTPNALSTTNVFAVTATVPGFTSQFTVNGGTTVTWSAAGYLLWSGRVLVIPAWRNAAYATAGYWDIYCPTSGTIISNGGTVTCTAAGIPMSGWFALYYRVVPGSGNTSVQANFLIKDYTDTTYSPDSNWILLAVRNGDSGELKWMPGNTTIPLGGTFYTPSASYDKVQVAGTVVVDSARTGIFTNLYSANSLTTTNVFATTANVGTLNVATISNLNTLVLTNNLYAPNALSTTNVFVSNGLDVGPGTLGTNVVIFSNISGGANTFVMDSNGRIGIGTTAPSYALDIGNPSGLTNKSTFLRVGSLGGSTANAGIIISPWNGRAGGPSCQIIGVDDASSSAHLTFWTAPAGGSTTSLERVRIINNGFVGINTTAPTANLHVAGNIYASNALSTTNIFATTANLTTANATTILATTANIVTANATTIYAANSVTTTNLVTAGFTSNSTNTTFNFDTITIPFINSTTLNVASFANVQTQTIQGSSGQASLIVTGNIYASNALSTANAYLTGTLNVQGTSNLSVANIANIYTTNIVGFVGSQWTGSTGSPIYYVPQVGVGTSVTTANLTVTGNIYASNSIQTGNLILGGVTSGGFLQAQGTANVASVSTIPIGSGGTNQTSYGTTGGVVYYDGTRFQAASGVRASTATTLNVTTANITTLQTNSFIPASSGLFMNLNASYTLTAGASWTGSIAGTITSNLYTLFAPIPGITGWDAYGSSAFVNAPTANGGIKFNQPGPYMITAVISADNDIKTIALSSNTADVHSNVTNVWSYCYRFGVGTNPSIPAIIPVNVTDTTKYYYIDYETTSQTDTIHRTAYTNTSAEAYTGSYVIIRPV